MSTEWVLASLIAVLSALIGALFKMSLDNKTRLSQHDVLLATVSEGLKKIDDIGTSVNRRFDKHEEKEDRLLSDITRKIEKLVINVALLKKSPNGDE